MSWAALAGGLNTAVLAHFGEATTYSPGVGQAVQVQGIFDAAYVRVDAGEAGVSSVGPAVWYRLADLPVDPVEDEPQIVVGTVTYEVREAQKDGQGGVLLLLRKVVT
jgi:hypothetical protein